MNDRFSFHILIGIYHDNFGNDSTSEIVKEKFKKSQYKMDEIIKLEAQHPNDERTFQPLFVGKGIPNIYSYALLKYLLCDVFELVVDVAFIIF